MRLSADRFDNYSSILARFPSTGNCGHEIKQGDQIGYNRRLRKTVCAACWHKWAAENSEAAAYEAGLPY